MRRNFDKLKARIEALEQQTKPKTVATYWDDGTEDDKLKIAELERQYDLVVVVGWAD